MFNIYVKLLLLTVVLIATLQTARFMFSTSYYLSARTSLEAFRAGTWSCELDRRLVLHLRNEIQDKEKLLKYREKVINSLRKRIAQLNATIEQGRNVDSIESIVSHRKRSLDGAEELSRNTGSSFDKQEDNVVEKESHATPFPLDLEKVARNGNKPCCIAVKRMSDILRQYMDTNVNLKHQVTFYEQMNLTAKLLRYGEIVRQQTIAKNCSTHFIPKKIDKQKNDLFLLSDMNSVYEAVPIYLEPRQKIGNFGAKHRSIDLKNAFHWALKEFNKKWKDKKDLASSAVDVLFKADPYLGNKYIFTLRTKSGRLFTLPVLRPLGPYIANGKTVEQSARAKELINIIVPLSGRSSSLEIFLRMFQEVCIKHKENVFLTIIMYGNLTNTNELKDIVHKFTVNTGFTAFDVMRRNLPFSRGRALDDGVKRWNGNENVLMFFCDVDVSFDRKFLRRCRTNTQKGKYVYYPVLFSQYNPSISKKADTSSYSVEIDSESGTWRPLGFGMACMYRSDYLKVGGFNLSIKGWGGEDNDLYNRFIKSPIKIIRAPDSGLFHKWHLKECDKSLDKTKYQHCLGAKARYEGSQRQLGLLLFKGAKR